MVAESIRRNQEMADMSHTDADSDAGLPDDSDDLDDPLEVKYCCTFSISSTFTIVIYRIFLSLFSRYLLFLFFSARLCAY